ncbi:MAG TPA: DUF4296 domain-containing protein [Puia sp.]|nr:DUF4296 domain-containing protein [Puia sp.]
MSGGKIVAAMIACLVAGAACSDKNRVPGDILPIDKMEQVMWDMTEADQYATLYVAKDSQHIDRKSETMRLYEEVFRLHDVSREQFRKSYRYYLDHPALNQELFDSIMARGVRARTEMYDRPSPYHPPAMPGRSGISPVTANPAGPGLTPGMAHPVRPGGLMPGTPVGPAGMALRRAQEAMARRQDSIARARHLRPDTARAVPGTHIRGGKKRN